MNTFRVALTISVIFCAICVYAEKPQKPSVDRPELVLKLLDEDQRNSAFAELLKINDYSGGLKENGVEKYPSRIVSHVVVCPQKQGDPLYAVFRYMEYFKKQGILPGKPYGGIYLFDSQGNQLPIYRNANFIEGIFKDVNQDGIVENIEVINVSAGTSPCNSVFLKSLYVLPVVKNAAPLLHVAYVPKGDGAWSHKIIDRDNDGILEIELGPKIEGEEGIKTDVVYVWSKEKQSYIGPEGSEDKQYKRLGLNPDIKWDDEINAFAVSKMDKNKKCPADARLRK